MSCVENLKTLVSPTPRKNNQEGTQKAIDQLRSKSKTEIPSTSITKMSFSKIEEQYAPKRKFRKRELLSESNNRRAFAVRTQSVFPAFVNANKN